MKKLIFIRHAKAEEETSSISDFERSLTVKGKVISMDMAEMLRKKENFNGIIISSPAFRAIETALIFSKSLGYDPGRIVISNALYPGTGLMGLQGILDKIRDEEETVILFGHNPSITELPCLLVRDGCDIMPKCGIICISFKIQKWSEIKQKTGKTEYYLKPKKVL
jgi:phosphohistidine phosphatase